jgi:hypothetical protein
MAFVLCYLFAFAEFSDADFTHSFVICLLGEGLLFDSSFAEALTTHWIGLYRSRLSSGTQARHELLYAFLHAGFASLEDWK